MFCRFITTEEKKAKGGIRDNEVLIQVSCANDFIIFLIIDFIRLILYSEN